jgi:hypothetical protein
MALGTVSNITSAPAYKSAGDAPIRFKPRSFDRTWPYAPGNECCVRALCLIGPNHLPRFNEMSIGSGRASASGAPAVTKVGDRLGHSEGSPSPEALPASRQSSRFRWRAGLEPLAVLTVALVARLPYLDHVPHKDELNHVLAARALLDTGTLAIVPDGTPYSRAWAFTYLVSGLFRMFGESLVVARIPAVLAGSALVLLLFLWVRSEVGRTGAWVAALLLAFVPISLQLSQWVRFYTLHALLLFASCLLIYRLLHARPSGWHQAAAIAGLAATLMGMAWHLQPITVIGAGGLALWLFLAAPGLLVRPFPAPGYRVLAAVVAGGLVLVAALAFSGRGESLLRMATHPPLWAESRGDHVRYYHQLFLDRYGVLWTLFPLAALLAGAARPKPALMALCVFGVAFVTHSFLAWKHERYLFYALPFFFAVWGMAVGSSLPWIMRRSRRFVRLGPGRVLPPTVQRLGAGLLLLGVVGFAAFTTPAVSYGHKMLTVPDAEWNFRWGNYRGEPNWEAAARELRPVIEAAEVIVGSYNVTALHAIGRLDYLLRPVGGNDYRRPEFTVESKTRSPAISSPASLATIMGCHGSGVIFIERGHWRNPSAVPPAAADLLEQVATPVPVPEHWRLTVFEWTSPLPGPRSGACADLPVRASGG